MLASAALALSAVVTSALATPLVLPSTLEERTPAACAWNSVTNVPQSFTLLAVSNTDSSLKEPLELGVIDGYQTGIRVIATTSSIKKSYGTNFTMESGAMYSIPVEGGGGVALSNYVPTENTLLEFTATDDSVTGKAIPAYCELFNTSPNGVEYPYVLAVNGDSDSFSLCQAPNKGSPVNVLVFAPVSDETDLYDGSTCKAVYVHALHDCC